MMLQHVVAAMMVAASLFACYLNRQGKTLWAALLVTATLFGTITACILAFGGLGSPLYAAYTICIVVAGLILVAALTHPSFQEEDRAPLSDIVLLVEDRTASQRLSDRAEQTEQAAETLAAHGLGQHEPHARRASGTESATNV